MKNIKTFAVAKKDVEKLSNQALRELIEFKSSDLYKIFKEVAEQAKVRRGQEALIVRDISDLRELGGITMGVEFIMDTVKRAGEELEDRMTKDKKE